MPLFQYNFCYCSIIDFIADLYDLSAFQYNFCYCSILSLQNNLHLAVPFQYNFCYCSMILLPTCTIYPLSFNTTFVTVLSLRVKFRTLFLPFQYNFCYCSIPAKVNDAINNAMFQYNFCYCSIQSPQMQLHIA